MDGRDKPGHDDQIVKDEHADDDPQAAGDGDPKPDRCGDRHLPAHAGAARRSGGLFRRPGRNAAGYPAGAGQSRPRQAADRAIRPLCRRSRPRQSRHFAHHRPAGRDRVAQPAAGIRGIDAARAHRLDRNRGAARHSGGDQAELADRPCLPRHRDRRRIAAGVLHRPDPGLRVLLSARLGAGAARPARRVLHAAAACHRLLPDRQPDRGRSRNIHGEPQAAHSAGAHARRSSRWRRLRA